MPAYRKNVSIYLVFVVPDDIYESYRYQDIVVKDPISKSFRRVIEKDRRLNRVQQWVLKIDTIRLSRLSLKILLDTVLDLDHQESQVRQNKDKKNPKRNWSNFGFIHSKLRARLDNNR